VPDLRFADSRDERANVDDAANCESDEYERHLLSNFASSLPASSRGSNGAGNDFDRRRRRANTYDDDELLALWLSVLFMLVADDVDAAKALAFFDIGGGGEVGKGGTAPTLIFPKGTSVTEGAGTTVHCNRICKNWAPILNKNRYYDR
jgi:hypothetical protein